MKRSGLPRPSTAVWIGRQSALLLAKGFRLLSPTFAPAECWWARTIVESIITYSKSGSPDSARNIRSQTPVSTTGCTDGTRCSRRRSCPGAHANALRSGRSRAPHLQMYGSSGRSLGIACLAGQQPLNSLPLGIAQFTSGHPPSGGH